MKTKMFFPMEHRTATDSIVHRAHQAQGHEHGTAEPSFGAFQSYAPMRYRPFLRKWNCQKSAFYRSCVLQGGQHSFVHSFLKSNMFGSHVLCLVMLLHGLRSHRVPTFRTMIVSTKFSHFPVHRKRSEYSQALSLLAMSALRVGLLGQC